MTKNGMGLHYFPGMRFWLRSVAAVCGLEGLGGFAGGARAWPCVGPAGAEFGVELCAFLGPRRFLLPGNPLEQRCRASFARLFFCLPFPLFRARRGPLGKDRREGRAKPGSGFLTLWDDRRASGVWAHQGQKRSRDKTDEFPHDHAGRAWPRTHRLHHHGRRPAGQCAGKPLERQVCRHFLRQFRPTPV